MLNNQPLFTIIIPTYNSGATLSIALESIINQSFRSLEVLIVDGLSTDNTIEIAQNYKKQFPNINIHSEKDNGIYDAMNKGIDLALGKWLFFMGSDDYFYKKTTLEAFLSHEDIKTHLVVYGNVYSPRFNGIYDGVFSAAKLAEKNICHQAIFFNKSIFKKIGSFNLKYKSHADWDHNMRWFYSTKISSVYINQIIAHYADNGFSSLNSDNTFKKDKFFKIIILGFRKMSYSELILNSNKAIMEYKTQKIYLKWITSYTLKFVYRFLRKIKSLLNIKKP